MEKLKTFCAWLVLEWGQLGTSSKVAIIAGGIGFVAGFWVRGYF